MTEHQAETERPEMAQTWRVEPGVGLIVNERVFPWHVAADPRPMVEEIEDGDFPLHILWLPLLVDAPLPEYGRPDGVPVPESVVETDAEEAS